jgi:hypothetical protein
VAKKQEPPQGGSEMSPCNLREREDARIFLPAQAGPESGINQSGQGRRIGGMAAYGRVTKRAQTVRYWQPLRPFVRQMEEVGGGGIGRPFSVISFMSSFSASG